MEQKLLKDDFALLKNRDKEAFARIYNELKLPVYTIAYRIVKSKELSEDITQEVFVRIFTSPPDNDIKNPRAWIFTVARNLALDQLKKSQALNIDEITTATHGIENDITTKLDVEEAVLALSTTEREIVTLHLNAGLSFKEISGITKLSLPSTYRRYKKALKKLRASLSGGAI